LIAYFTDLSRDAFYIYAGLFLCRVIGIFYRVLFHCRQLKSNFIIWAVVIVAISAELFLMPMFAARDDLINHGL